MNDAVTDGVGKDWITDLFSPAGDVKLRAEYCGAVGASCFNEFKKIVGLIRRKIPNKLFIHFYGVLLLTVGVRLKLCAIAALAPFSSHGYESEV